MRLVKRRRYLSHICRNTNRRKELPICFSGIKFVFFCHSSAEITRLALDGRNFKHPITYFLRAVPFKAKIEGS